VPNPCPYVTERDRLSCILVALTDGSLRAFDYPDEQSAESWYRESREEWNAGRTVVFYVRWRGSTSTERYGGDEVAHLEITTRDNAEARGAECQDALIFG
jgi:hypothetical protein